VKIEITPTDKLAKIGGVIVRAWEGTTDDGTRCIVFVHHVIYSRLELYEKLTPGRRVPLRDILD
jgi:hypothetical protein